MMSAERRPRCGLADRVLSIFTARTCPFRAPERPVKGWPVPEVVGEDDGDAVGVLTVVGGATLFVRPEPEQAESVAAVSAAALSTATRGPLCTWRSDITVL